MKSAIVDAFFSCSFLPEDKKVNELFYAICKALNIRCSNVSTAFTSNPPEIAKKIISDSQALIAICTRRTELKNGHYVMPDAVHEELSFAFGKGIPVLMFIENDVQKSGFQNNFGTHYSFNRDELHSVENLEKIITAVHTLKMELVSHNDIIYGQGFDEFYSDYMRYLFEMKEYNSDYFWDYSCTKKLTFTKSYKGSFPTSIWKSMSCKIPEGAKPIFWEIKVDNSSGNLKIKHTIEKQTPEYFDALLKIEPHPAEGDFIEYSIHAESRYLNAIWEDELLDDPPLHLTSGDYMCFDGWMPIQRTKKAYLTYRFPRSYGLSKQDIAIFAGSFSSKIDYEVESELNRAKKEIQTIAGNLQINIEIDSPLLGHAYGIAWNPKHRII